MSKQKMYVNKVSVTKQQKSRQNTGRPQGNGGTLKEARGKLASPPRFGRCASKPQWNCPRHSDSPTGTGHMSPRQDQGDCMPRG